MGIQYQKNTCDISIIVNTSFIRTDYKDQDQYEYQHLYQILISNEGKEPVRLLRRHWRVLQLPNKLHEFIGEGVIGEQPIIEPNDTFKYYSYASTQSMIGKMWGTYEMENQISKEIITVEIPVFTLIVPWLLN